MSDDKTIIADSSAFSALKAPKKTTACLIQYNGTNLGKRYVLNKPEMVIGRSQEGDIVINEQSVSRQHAKCYTKAERIEVEDLGSSNGTYVNDERISSKAPLKDGDIVRLGTVLLKYFSQNNVENLFHDKIYRMATIDGGTQIFNKKYLLESLKEEFQYSKSFGRELSIIYFDLDFFKKVNDTHGHNAGDFILKESAQLIKGTIRADDIFCRFGGEEFIILMPGANAKTAFDSAERIRKLMESHEFKFEQLTIKQTISLGVSQLNDSMNEPNHLLDDADRKLYQSKQNGRNQVTI